MDDIDFMHGEERLDQDPCEPPPPLVEFGSADREGIFCKKALFFPLNVIMIDTAFFEDTRNEEVSDGCMRTSQSDAEFEFSSGKSMYA